MRYLSWGLRKKILLDMTFLDSLVGTAEKNGSYITFLGSSVEIDEKGLFSRQLKIVEKRVPLSWYLIERRF